MYKNIHGFLTCHLVHSLTFFFVFVVGMVVVMAMVVMVKSSSCEFSHPFYHLAHHLFPHDFCSIYVITPKYGTFFLFFKGVHFLV